MRIAIVTGRNGIHVRELTEAAVRRGHVVVPVEFQHLVADVDEAADEEMARLTRTDEVVEKRQGH